MKIFYIFLFLLFPMQIFAGVGDHDNRYYVTDEMWAQEPYKKFVHLTTMVSDGENLKENATCSAQYISKNLILSAGHCTGDDAYKVENYKHERFSIQLIESPYKKEKNKTDDLGDWAVWLVTDPQYYSDAYFDISVPTQTMDVINAGWGWARIIEDREIPVIRNLLKKIQQVSEKNVLIDDVIETLSEKMTEQGIEPIYDFRYRLKASNCKIIFEDCFKLLKANYKTYETNQLVYDVNTSLPYNSYMASQQNKLKQTLSSIEQKFTDICNNQLLMMRSNKYPYILATTCDSWGGNSGGGYISPNGKYLYGICSYGIRDDDFADLYNTDYITSVKQFESNIKTLINQYDSKNSVEKNIAQIPKEFAQSVVTHLKDGTVSEETKSTNEQTMSLRIGMHIQELRQETQTLDTNLMMGLSKVQDMTDNQLLAYLNKIVEYQVKSEELEKLEKAYRDARDKEQSTANKLLTAATVAATGLGGMEWARGAAEQWADEEAETEMAGYLAGMRCEYGGGQTLNLGAEMTLPAGDLTDYYTEYKQLADKLKETKAALNLRPGIESEVLYDQAQSGLYQYQTAEVQSGGNPSLSRALMNPDGEDAAAWNAQNAESAEKAESGKGWGIGGAVGGALGNIGINNTDLIKNISGKNGN